MRLHAPRIVLRERQADPVRKNKKSLGISKLGGKAGKYRKGNKGPQASKPTRAQKATDTAVKLPNMTSPLLQLPAELRNNVYEKILEDEPKAYLSKCMGSTLVSLSSLAKVNRQVRNEFLSVVYLCAGQIIVSVTDFDFRHIVTFFNRLSDAEMTAIIETPTSRNLSIELTFTDKFSGNLYSEDFALLDRWIRRLEHPTKRGTNIDASYVVAENRYGWRYPLLSWKVEKKWYPQGRKAEEAIKISRAIWEWERKWKHPAPRERHDHSCSRCVRA